MVEVKGSLFRSFQQRVRFASGVTSSSGGEAFLYALCLSERKGLLKTAALDVVACLLVRSFPAAGVPLQPTN